MVMRDTLVIGAGVVGLAVARALAMRGDSVVVAERAGHIGDGVSSRNSEVLHAGLYYKPGSLKASACVQGRAMVVDYCEQRHVPYRLCGKLIVATDEAQVAGLDGLYAKAQANGVRVQRLSGAQAQAMEPALSCVAALYSPDTGIVDSHALMLALLADVEAHGGVVAFGSQVVAGQARGATPGQPAGPHTIRIACTEAGTTQTSDWQFDVVVNCASLHAPQVAACIDGFDPAALPMPYFAKGNYCDLSTPVPFKHLVYPAPQDAWLGIHLTLDLAGRARFGPDQHWLDTHDADALDYTTTPDVARSFEASVRRYWPDLPHNSLQASYCGIRPRIYGPGQAAPDFRIDGPAQHGVPGWVNAFGIESPGLTSAMALAQHVATLV
ncbi:MAG: NAD(P)/FAD-dependent oxidoreductase [Burkholderiaceae bacterium]|nr:NAD(P)/FAD-dependent oxidoreductase [Burkholderiaceae bacterium]